MTLGRKVNIQETSNNAILSVRACKSWVPRRFLANCALVGTFPCFGFPGAPSPEGKRLGTLRCEVRVGDLRDRVMGGARLYVYQQERTRNRTGAYIGRYIHTYIQRGGVQWCTTRHTRTCVRQPGLFRKVCSEQRRQVASHLHPCVRGVTQNADVRLHLSAPVSQAPVRQLHPVDPRAITRARDGRMGTGTVVQQGLLLHSTLAWALDRAR